LSAGPVPPRHLWWLAAGFGLWGSALVLLYALQALGCAFGWAEGPLRMGLAGLLLAHLIVIGWMWRDWARGGLDRDYGKTGSFLQAAVVWTLIAAFVTAVLTLGAPLLLALCV
jgi:hypothetical protein